MSLKKINKLARIVDSALERMAQRECGELAHTNHTNYDDSYCAAFLTG